MKHITALDNINATRTSHRFVEPVKAAFVLAKMPILQCRAFLRDVLGIESPSLIHNGKKRKK